MSQSEGTSNTKSSTTRTSWKDTDKVKFFLDCCINEVAIAGREGTSLRKESWERVAKQLKEKYNMIVAQKQMKNQFDYLRSMYVEWSNLVNKNTGHGYNPITKTMDWTPEKWEEYLKAHPKASTFRVSGFRWEDEGKALFEGVSATGSMGWGPARNVPRPSSTSSTNLHDIEDDQVDGEENTYNPTLAPDPSEPYTIDVQPSKKKKKVDDIERKFDKFLDIFMMDAVNLKKDGSNIISEPTLIDCCKKLDEMSLNPTDMLYVQAAVLFSDEKMRVQWIQWCGITEDSTARTNWLKSMLKMKTQIFLVITISYEFFLRGLLVH